MGFFIYESEHSSVIAPVRLFKGFFVDAVNLFSKVASQVIKSSEILEGDGGVGTIMKLTFSEASPYRYVKRRIDIADEASYKYGYTVIEGDALIKYKLEKIEYRHELVANADGGCTMKSVSKYYFVDDVDIKEEDVKAEKEKGSGLFKLVEAYLKANPDLYN